MFPCPPSRTQAWAAYDAHALCIGRDTDVSRLAPPGGSRGRYPQWEGQKPHEGPRTCEVSLQRCPLPTDEQRRRGLLQGRRGWPALVTWWVPRQGPGVTRWAVGGEKDVEQGQCDCAGASGRSLAGDGRRKSVLCSSSLS